MADKYKKYCKNCRYSIFLHTKDKPCINCVLIPSQFLTKKEITDEDIPMGRLDKKELIKYRKLDQSVGDFIQFLREIFRGKRL